MTAHAASYAYSMELVPGDQVQVGANDESWPEWLWCTDKQGVSAWIHESFLDRADFGARLRRRYSSRELTIAVGERVTAVGSVGGWCWCMKDEGATGWVPDTCLHR
ncbi:MAG TPA: SH3 domain-containing protein [Candidatus Dormibacteraeota bacterium]